MKIFFYAITIFASLSLSVHADRGDEYIHTVKDVNSELITASEKGNIGQVIELIENNANVNYNKDGLTPLIAAVKNNKKKVVSALLGAGANVNITDGNGNTALIIASMKGYADIVEMLLKVKGINIDTHNKNDKTAISITYDICRHRSDMKNFCTIADLLNDAYKNKPKGWVDGKVRK